MKFNDPIIARLARAMIKSSPIYELYLNFSFITKGLTQQGEERR